MLVVKNVSPLFILFFQFVVQQKSFYFILFMDDLQLLNFFQAKSYLAKLASFP